MTDQVTCKTCKHNRASWMDRTFNMNSWGWKCSLDYKEPEYNPVDGTTRNGYYEGCGVVRVKEKICGKDAKAWEPRHKKDFFIYLKRI